jgi:hypothetical protein
VTAERPSRSLNTRELLQRTVIRIRQDLTRVERLTEIVGINQPPPPEVGQALQVLSDYTVELLAAGRPPRPPGRPPRPTTADAEASPQPRRSAGPWPSYVEPGPLAARPRRRDSWRLRAP